MSKNREGERLVSIGMWAERYRHMLDVVVSHRSYSNMMRVNRARVLGELVEKEFKKECGEDEKRKD